MASEESRGAKPVAAGDWPGDNPDVWKPIRTPSDLPPLKTAESPWLDFKGAPTTDYYEVAKDVAAMANASGGTLLVGAYGGQTLQKYEPVADVGKVERDYDQAIRDRVRPAPLFDIARIAEQVGFLLALNVEPFPGQVVGVHLKAPETARENLFHYPLRVGTQTKFITPEQVPMFMDAKVRRVSILLEAARGAEADVRWLASGIQSVPHSSDATVGEVDPMGNTLVLSNIERSGQSVWVPLDLVESVCRNHSERWQLFVRGWLEHRGSRLYFTHG